MSESFENIVAAMKEDRYIGYRHSNEFIREVFGRIANQAGIDTLELLRLVEQDDGGDYSITGSEYSVALKLLEYTDRLPRILEVGDIVRAGDLQGVVTSIDSLAFPKVLWENRWDSVSAPRESLTFVASKFPYTRENTTVSLSLERGAVRVSLLHEDTTLIEWINDGYWNAVDDGRIPDQVNTEGFHAALLEEYRRFYPRKELRIAE